jgi:hypothetical protein
MNNLQNKFFLLLILIHFIGLPISVNAQTKFEGDFLFKWNSSLVSNTEYPLLCHVKNETSGNKLAIEILDDLRSKGVKKSILFDPADSTWTMLISINNLKMGTSVKRGAIFRDRKKEPSIKIKRLNINKKINGYTCREIVLESNAFMTSIWITNQFSFETETLFSLLAHCGVLENLKSECDWQTWSPGKGMILRVDSKNKKTNELISLNISEIKTHKVDDFVFSKEGYKISIIPEGQNCGVVKETE